MMKRLKYDLHLHANTSRIKSANVRPMRAAELIGILIEHEVDVFSVTDHNGFDHHLYADLKRHIDDNQLSIRFIPGAELDVATTIDYGHLKKTYDTNFLFYFKEAYPDLENVINVLYMAQKKPDMKKITKKFRQENYEFIVIPQGTSQAGIESILQKMDPTLAKHFHGEIVHKTSNNNNHSGFAPEDFEQWVIDYLLKTDELNALLNGISKHQEEQQQYLEDLLSHQDKTRTETDKQLIDEVRYFNLLVAQFKFSNWYNKTSYQCEHEVYLSAEDVDPYETLLSILDHPEHSAWFQATDDTNVNTESIQQFAVHGK